MSVPNDLGRACLRARVQFVVACIWEDFEAIWMAYDQAFAIAVEHRERPLPFLSDMPEMDAVIQAARHAGTALQAEAECRKRHERWSAGLPTPLQLRDQALAWGDKPFHFHGYTFWPDEERGDWSITNAYGIDDCARLDSEKSFAWFLATLREGTEIGLAPTISHSQDDEDYWTAFRTTTCKDAAITVIESLR